VWFASTGPVDWDGSDDPDAVGGTGGVIHSGSGAGGNLGLRVRGLIAVKAGSALPDSVDSVRGTESPDCCSPVVGAFFAEGLIVAVVAGFPALTPVVAQPFGLVCPDWQAGSAATDAARVTAQSAMPSKETNSDCADTVSDRGVIQWSTKGRGLLYFERPLLGARFQCIAARSIT